MIFPDNNIILSGYLGRYKSYTYSLLASVPALLCRLGRVSYNLSRVAYNRSFGALTRVIKSVAINQKNSVSWIQTQDKKFMN